METGALPDELRGADELEREQQLDFVGRMYRQTLLCHADAELREPGPEAVRGMLAATPARPVGEEACLDPSSAARTAPR